MSPSIVFSLLPRCSFDIVKRSIKLNLKLRNDLNEHYKAVMVLDIQAQHSGTHANFNRIVKSSAAKFPSANFCLKFMSCSVKNTSWRNLHVTGEILRDEVRLLLVVTGTSVIRHRNKIVDYTTRVAIQCTVRLMISGFRGL